MMAYELQLKLAKSFQCFRLWVDHQHWWEDPTPDQSN